MARSPKSSDVHKDVTILTSAQKSGRTRSLRAQRKKRVADFTRKVVVEMVKNPDMTLKEAGTRAGANPKTAASRAHRALKSESAQELFRREMSKRKGLQFSALAEKLEQGLSATQTKFFAHEGTVMDERDVIDYGARHSYLALAARLAGADPATRMELTGKDGEKLIPQANNTLVVLPQLTIEQLLALLDVKEPIDVTPVVAEVKVEGEAGS